MSTEIPSPPIRWRPALWILAAGVIAFLIIQAKSEWAYEQQRIYALIGAVAGTFLALVVWWLFFSRAGWRLRLTVLVIAALPAVLFKHRGMSGDFMPSFEFRFGKKTAQSPALSGVGPIPLSGLRADYLQFLGADRNGRLSSPVLDPNWPARPPEIIWRQPIGAAWSGFTVKGSRIFTQEQSGENELVSCYELADGRPVWKQSNPGRYATAIAGEGPRGTPTIAGDFVFTFGALGTLQCLKAETGERVWMQDVTKISGATVPEWGYASSPLIHEGKVIVSAGGTDNRSLIAFNMNDGTVAWTGGSRPVSYSSPFLFELGGRSQIVMFNREAITSHDPKDGAVLWEHPWGKGMPHVAAPVKVGDNKLLFSSGYGVGSALLEIKAEESGKLTAVELWKTIRFQAKFSNVIERDGLVYGLSDGMFACLDLKDGSVLWKSGRYGHGQGLLVNDLFLLMSENGGLLLLKPSSAGLEEAGQIKVFEDKTWNSIALAGEYLLVRNDREAACIRLPVLK